MSTRSCPRRSASARDTPPLVRVKSNWATLATGENPAPVRLRGSNEGVWWMRFHRPKRRQSASTSTWPPCAVAWSELVRRRCRVDFCFVNNGMDTHHHKGDVAASTISPAIAFLFTRLRIGADSVRRRGSIAEGNGRTSLRWASDLRYEVRDEYRRHNEPIPSPWRFPAEVHRGGRSGCRGVHNRAAACAGRCGIRGSK